MIQETTFTRITFVLRQTKNMPRRAAFERELAQAAELQKAPLFSKQSNLYVYLYISLYLSLSLSLYIYIYIYTIDNINNDNKSTIKQQGGPPMFLPPPSLSLSCLPPAPSFPLNCDDVDL